MIVIVKPQDIKADSLRSAMCMLSQECAVLHYDEDAAVCEANEPISYIHTIIAKDVSGLCIANKEAHYSKEDVVFQSSSFAIIRMNPINHSRDIRVLSCKPIRFKK